MSIRNKLIIVLLSVSITSFGIVGLLSIISTKKALTENITRSSFEFTQIAMKRINEYLYERSIDIKSWSNAEEMKDILTQDIGGRISEYMKSIKESYGEYYYIIGMDRSGRVVSSSEPEIIGMDFSGTEEFQEALKGKLHIQDVKYEKKVKDYTLIFSHPIRHSSNKAEIIGVIAAYLKWEIINKMNIDLRIMGREQNEANHIMLTRKDGQVISCFDPEEMFTTNLVTIGMRSANFAQEGKEGSLTEMSEHNIPSFSTYTYFRKYREMPNLGWLLVSLQDPRTIFSPVADLQNTIIFTIVIMGVLLIIASFLFANMLTKPILSIASAAKEIQKGKLEAKVNVTSKDEIGFLATSFNEMTKKLRETIELRNHEIAERKKAEDKLESANQQLEASNQQQRASNQQLRASQQQLNNEITERKKADEEIKKDEELLKKQAKELDRSLKEALKSREIMVSMLEDNNQAREGLEKKVEERTKELVIANKHLVKADRVKSEFLANVSHELRTPLNSIVGFAEVLQNQKSGKLSEKQVKYVTNIHTSGWHLSELINDILDLSKIESGKMELLLSQFSFPELIENSKVIIKELAFKKNIAVKSRISSKISVINADEKKMKQIMYNLLSNAVKFTLEDGKIEISADIKDEKLQVSVADTGIGIEQKDMDKIFEVFCQIDSKYAHKYTGSGLGLSLTKKMVELHGGEIWAESEFEKGSTFTFTVPLRKSKV